MTFDDDGEAGIRHEERGELFQGGLRKRLQDELTRVEQHFRPEPDANLVLVLGDAEQFSIIGDDLVEILEPEDALEVRTPAVCTKAGGRVAWPGPGSSST
jgi:hypothetical protein